jgi:hypothetical protein
MTSKRSFTWTTRLLLLALALTPLLLSAPKQPVKAFTYTCTQLMEFCYYNCAVANEGDATAYNACAAQCELNRNGCETCTQYQLPQNCSGGFEDMPEPYPVVANYTMCMDNCLSCMWLPPAERSECWSPCKVSCIELYGN